MNALDFLKQEHQEVESMFQQIESDSTKGKEILPKLRQALLTHAHIEEQYFYPELERFDELKEMLKEARQEHKQVEKELQQISTTSLENGQWQSMITKMHQDVEHHVREEEGEMFPKVQRLLESEKLNQIGQKLEEAKAREMAQR